MNTAGRVNMWDVEVLRARRAGVERERFNGRSVVPVDFQGKSVQRAGVGNRATQHGQAADTDFRGLIESQCRLHVLDRDRLSYRAPTKALRFSFKDFDHNVADVRNCAIPIGGSVVQVAAFYSERGGKVHSQPQSSQQCP